MTLAREFLCAHHRFTCKQKSLVFDQSQLTMAPKPADKKRKRVDTEQDGEDQAVAFLKGFESSEEDLSGDEGFAPGQDVPALPDTKALNKKLKVVSQKGEGSEPGVVYVGYVYGS